MDQGVTTRTTRLAMHHGPGARQGGVWGPHLVSFSYIASFDMKTLRRIFPLIFFKAETSTTPVHLPRGLPGGRFSLRSAGIFIIDTTGSHHHVSHPCVSNLP